MAYIEVVSKTTSTITVRINGLSTDYSYDGRGATFFLGNQQKHIENIPAKKEYTESKTFSGLSPNTTYTIDCIIYNINNNNQYISKQLESITVKTKDVDYKEGVELWWDLAYRHNDGIQVMAGLSGISSYHKGATGIFAIYIPGNFTPIEVKETTLDHTLGKSNQCTFDTVISYDTEYILGASIYKNGSNVADFDVMNVYVASPSKIKSIRRQDEPWKIDVTAHISSDDYTDVWLSCNYLDNLFQVEKYGKEEEWRDLDGYYGEWAFSPMVNLSGLSGEVEFEVSLPHTGQWQFALTDSTGGAMYTDPYMLTPPKYSTSVEIESYSESPEPGVGGIVIFNIEDVWNPGNKVSFSYYALINEDWTDTHYGTGDIEYSNECEELDLSASFYQLLKKNESRKVTFVCEVSERVESLGRKIITNIIKKSVTLPELETIEGSVSAIRSESDPSNILISIDVTSTSGTDITYIEIYKLDRNPGTIDKINVYSGSYSNTLTYNVGYEHLVLDISVYKESGWSEWFMCSIPEYIEETQITHWTWPTQEQKLLEDGGATRDFRHSVWNDLAAKISEVRLAAGYDAWNEHFAKYEDTCMSDGDTELTAVRYNSLKNNIGYIWSTGINDVNPGEVVEGTKHFINLTIKLNEWIDKINNG